MSTGGHEGLIDGEKVVELGTLLGNDESSVVGASVGDVG